MIALTVQEIVESTQGTLLSGSPDAKLHGVSVDTRTIVSGDLFIPLQDKRDGHQFISDAVKAGASGYLIQADCPQKDRLASVTGSQCVIEVKNTLQALQDIAAYHRTKLNARVIGITGSTGKTTTKDMLNCVLAHRYRVVSTDKNHNNEIGLPLTILRADALTEVLVLEMAMRGAGQIRQLAQIARPDIGVITNVGQAHMELLGSEEGIARAKAELIEAIPETGIAVINADDLWADYIVSCACSKIVTFGIAEGDVRGSKIEADEMGRASFRLNVADGPAYVVRLTTPGKHNVYNALAVAAVAVEMGVRPDDVRIGLSACRPSTMRMEVFSTDDNVMILNDTYNANPASMQAALATLMDVKADGRHIAVLGDMLELGSISREAHSEIGEIVASLGVNILVAVGEESLAMAESAVSAGMHPKAVIACPDSNTAVQILKQLIEPGDVVLAKASRGIGLEVVVRALVSIV